MSKNKYSHSINCRAIIPCKTYLIIILLLVNGFANAQSFKALIDRMNSLPAEERQLVVDSFMKLPHSFPLIVSDSIVHFIYQGLFRNSLERRTFPGKKSTGDSVRNNGDRIYDFLYQSGFFNRVTTCFL